MPRSFLLTSNSLREIVASNQNQTDPFPPQLHISRLMSADRLKQPNKRDDSLLACVNIFVYCTFAKLLITIELRFSA